MTGEGLARLGRDVAALAARWDAPPPRDGPAPDMLSTAVPPPLRIEVVDPIDAPLWLFGTYYRGVLPARAVGGRFASEVWVKIGNGAWQRISLERIEDAKLLRGVAERGETVAISGLSRTLTVVGATGAKHSATITVRAALIAGLRQAGINAWVDVDDYQGGLDFAGIERSFVAACRRRAGPFWMPSPRDERDMRVLYERHRNGLETAFFNALGAAAGVVAANRSLADLAATKNPVVRVIANGVPADDMAHTRRRSAAAPVRVGMTGSALKFYEDIDLALPGLLAAGREPGVALHFFGGLPGGGGGGVPPGQWRPGVLDGVPFEWWAFDGDILRYQRRAGLLDVAALPLRPDFVFNRHKSPQKWMEMALHGTATVLQRLEPYELAAEGETCLKAGEPEEWTEQLLRLVADHRLRRRIGEAARAEVLAKHTMAARRPLWKALLAEAAA